MVRWVVPLAWRNTLRLRAHRLLHPRRFHLYPHHVFSRYQPRRQSVQGWLRTEAGFHWWRYTQGRGQRLQRPIFMIGCSRSGTTVSVRMFARHPDVADFSEAVEIWDPRQYTDGEASHSWTAADVTPDDTARLHARFEYFRRLQGKERFINKNPKNSLRIDYLRAVFPDAVFIHVIRDGRAVVASMLGYLCVHLILRASPVPFHRPADWRELMREDEVERCALQWHAVLSYVLCKRAELGPAYHEFKYEDFCEDPKGVLGAAYRFAGLRVDEEVLGRLPERLESKNYKWKTQLRPEQIEMVTRIQAPLLTELGYPL